MAKIKFESKKKSPSGVIAKKNEQIRKELWPEITDEMIWHRTKHDGFASIPRTMPYVYKIMDELADKGKPVSNVYFALWCRAFDEHVLKIVAPGELASESGFTGQRSLYTWKERMHKLAELGFIKVHQDESNNFDYVALIDPYYAIEQKKENIPKKLLEAFNIRKIAVGA